MVATIVEMEHGPCLHVYQHVNMQIDVHLLKKV